MLLGCLLLPFCPLGRNWCQGHAEHAAALTEGQAPTPLSWAASGKAGEVARWHLSGQFPWGNGSMSAVPGQSLANGPDLHCHRQPTPISSHRKVLWNLK